MRTMFGNACSAMLASSPGRCRRLSSFYTTFSTSHSCFTMPVFKLYLLLSSSASLFTPNIQNSRVLLPSLVTHACAQPLENSFLLSPSPLSTLVPAALTTMSTIEGLQTEPRTLPYRYSPLCLNLEHLSNSCALPELQAVRHQKKTPN